MIERSTLAVCLSLALVGCGKDGGNGLPEAVDQLVSTLEDTPVDVILDATDPDDDALTFAIVTPPAHGTLGDLDGDTVVYTPDPDFAGEDAFTWEVTDDVGQPVQAEVTLSVQPVNDAPVTTASAAPTALVNQRVRLTSSTTDVDTDLSSVTATWVQTSGPTISVDGASAPEASFTPRAVGTYTFSVTSSDRDLTSAAAIVSVDVWSLSAGDQHMIVVKPDGTMWGAGEGDGYQLANGSDREVSRPEPICKTLAEGGGCQTEFTGVRMADVGNDFTLAVAGDGSIWGWGAGADGQLGDSCFYGVEGSCVDQAEPVRVCQAIGRGVLCVPLGSVVGVAGGGAFGVAVQSTGDVWGWGDNDDGQVGDSSFDRRTVAVPACRALHGSGNFCGETLDGIVAVAAGMEGAAFAVALADDGTVYTWGSGSDGQLGDGCIEDDDDCDERAIAGQVCAAWNPGTSTCDTVLSGIVSIAAAEEHAVALGEDGRVYAWGRNTFGQLGDGCPGGVCDDRGVAMPVCAELTAGLCTRFLEDVVHVATGEDHVLAVTADGAVWAWGNDSDGQLGRGCESQTLECTEAHLPGRVCALPEEGGCNADLGGATAVAAGERFSFALLADGRIVAWGDNTDGQLGEGTHHTYEARQVGSDTDWTDLAAGEDFSAALKANGAVWTWGERDDGKLGDDCDLLTDGCDTLRDAGELVGPSALVERDWRGLSTGLEHGVALKANGRIGTWGLNDDGALGSATLSATSRVIQPVGIDGSTPDADWAAVYAGFYTTIARKSGGTLWAWGAGSDGQLGDGLEDDSDRPVQVLGGDGVNHDTDWGDVAIGDGHVLGLKTTGRLYAWGEGGDGQLGLDSFLDVAMPTQVRGADGVTFDTNWEAVGAGWEHSIAVKTTGTLWTWGNDNRGQLGLGCEASACTFRDVPTQVPSVSGAGFDTDWVTVTAAGDRSFATKTDGTVYAWGADDTGALGVGFVGDVDAPTVVCVDFDRATSTCVAPLTGVVAVRGSEDHTLALDADGALWAWGDNCERELGIGGGCASGRPHAITW